MSASLVSLAGKVAVVTGGARGIGLGIARKLLAAEMRVVLADIDRSALSTASNELAREGSATGFCVDVSEMQAMERLADFVFETYGAAHVLVNNAGIARFDSAVNPDMSDWQHVLAVDLLGVVHGVKAFLPRMIESGEPGHVINTASTAGLLPLPGCAAYAAAKAGVIAFTEVLKRELVALGLPIGASVLVPVHVNTDLSKRPPGSEPLSGRGPGPPRDALTTPETTGEQVVDALRTGRFWVVTHPYYLPSIVTRSHGIADGFTIVEPPPR